MSMEINWSIIMAKRLRQLRDSRKLTYEKLSEILSDKYGIKISSDSLMNYEVAKTHHTKTYKNLGMRVEYLRCFADFYGVSTDYLLGLADNPVLDQSTRAVCEYTGLSPATAKLLHSDKTSGFSVRLIDAILESDGIARKMPEAIQNSADALAAQASVALIRHILGQLPDDEECVASISISKESDDKFYIHPALAARLYLSEAIEVATANIAKIVTKMRDDEVYKALDPENPDGTKIEIEITEQNLQ